MIQCLKIIVKGRVQGVGFRWSAKKAAEKYNLEGIVKNLTNGNVYIEAEGNKENLEQFVIWCHQGPNYAQVENVQTEEIELKNYTGFSIR